MCISSCYPKMRALLIIIKLFMHEFTPFVKGCERIKSSYRWKLFNFSKMTFVRFFHSKCLINANNPIIYWEKWQEKQTPLKYARYCEERFTFQYLFCISVYVDWLFSGVFFKWIISVLTRSHLIPLRIVFAKDWVFSMFSRDFNCGRWVNLKVFTVF